jgi:hypothetical protein
MIHKALSRFSNSASMSFASSRCSWSAISRFSLSIRRRCRLYSLNSSVSFDQLGGTDLIKSAIYKSISSGSSRIFLTIGRDLRRILTYVGLRRPTYRPFGPAFGDRPASLRKADVLLRQPRRVIRTLIRILSWL